MVTSYCRLLLLEQQHKRIRRRIVIIFFFSNTKKTKHAKKSKNKKTKSKKGAYLQALTFALLLLPFRSSVLSWCFVVATTSTLLLQALPSFDDGVSAK
jgi:hypothetical protein